MDVEFPYIYRASKDGEKNIAIRFSEDESIETIKKYIGQVSWVWIDTNTRLPVSNENKETLNQFKKCLVCPERWGRSNEIDLYKKIMGNLKFEINAVMTSYSFVNKWKYSLNE